MRSRRRRRVGPQSPRSRRPWPARRPRSTGSGRRSPSRRSRCTCTREKHPGTERRPGPGQGGRYRQGRLARPGRRRRRAGLDPEAGGRAARAGRGTAAALGGPSGRRPAGRRHPGRGAGPRAAAGGTGGDRVVARALGRGGQVAPQAGPPRLPARPGSRLGVDGVAGAEGRKPAPTRPFTSRAADQGAVAGVGGVEAQRHLVLRLHPLHPSKRVAVAVLDIVSRKWLASLVSAEETSTQIEVCFTDALTAEGLDQLLDHQLLARLRAGEVDPDDLDDEAVPVLLAMSDNGPQMRSHTTREFMAACAIMQRFGRPGTPTDQAWIESLFGHVKADWPHLEKIRDPGGLAAELDRVRSEYNTVRLHAGIGYVTPDDEHHGRGDAIRQARRDGLTAARQARIAYRRTTTRDPS